MIVVKTLSSAVQHAKPHDVKPLIHHYLLIKPIQILSVENNLDEQRNLVYIQMISSSISDFRPW